MIDTSLFAEIVMERCVHADHGIPSPRELVAGYYWALGISRDQIAEHMGIVPGTVHVHLREFVDKVSTNGFCDSLRFDLAAEYWMKRGQLAS